MPFRARENIENIENIEVKSMDSIIQSVNRYFIKRDSLYILNDRIKSNVTFKVINLFDLSFKNIGKFDYIFSRNTLIYFDRETKYKAKNILEELRKNQDQEIFFGHADLL